MSSFKGQHHMDFSQASRKSDPDTSRLAEDKITQSGKRQRHADMIYNVLKRYNGLTSAEISIHLPLTYLQVVRRMKDLTENSLVRQGAKRECEENGSQCSTWWLI